MLKYFLCIVIIFLSAPIHAVSQKNYDDLDFSAVDKFARSIRYDDDLNKLTQELVSPYTEDIFKLRAIFIWVTDNIAYDYKLYNEGNSNAGFRCTGKKADCDIARAEWENATIASVLEKKMGVCSGYSRLVKKMCELAGIKCEVVPGYVKKSPFQIGLTLNVTHAWNAVQIDGNYYFLDATWAAGNGITNEDGDKLTGFKKDFHNYYWLTPFNKLVRNHFPENEKWVMQKEYTKEKFFNTPYYAGPILDKIELISPNTGMLNAKKGDTIHFEFSYNSKISYIQVNSNTYRSPTLPVVRNASNELVIRTNDSSLIKNARFIPFKQTSNNYKFDYVVTDQSLYYMEILFDFRMVMKFKIKVE